MNKIIATMVIALSLLVIPSTVLAQDSQKGQGISQQQGTGGIVAASQSLDRVSQRNNNPEIGEQIRVMVQSHEQVQARTETALNKMSQRNQAVKLIIGPDYKNAGQVKSDVVGLRDDIEELELLKEDSLPADEEDIQGAIDQLEVEAEDLEVKLDEQLSGTSLLGWLMRLFVK
ncbi:hypothetical protein KKD03_05405 [Patescibacteria group bacterium]|nr:hypothetical protein [Patescibacteria group bacterium]